MDHSKKEGDMEPRTSKAPTTTTTIRIRNPELPDSGFRSTESSESVHRAVTTPGLLRLRLSQPEPERHVGFHEGVIDNEHMNRRKSKCCCIYRKPHPFGESSSSTDDECEHCFGHPEVRTRNRLEKQRKPRPKPKPCSCCCSGCRPDGPQDMPIDSPEKEPVEQAKDQDELREIYEEK
ncbi:hypothetical protein KR009_011868 [Drosophila setifemur]|nr:hypothetical protein KR009_011868 [Drosophila setifemur]